MELQITQTRHPKSVWDGWTDGRSRPITRPAFAKATQVKIVFDWDVKNQIKQTKKHGKVYLNMMSMNNLYMGQLISSSIHTS